MFEDLLTVLLVRDDLGNPLYELVVDLGRLGVCMHIGHAWVKNTHRTAGGRLDATAFPPCKTYSQPCRFEELSATIGTGGLVIVSYDYVRFFPLHSFATRAV